MNGRDNVRLANYLKISVAGSQLRVIPIQNADRKTRLVGDDGRDRPAVQRFPGKVLMLWYRQLPVRAENEAVTCVEEGNRPALPGVKGVHNIFKAGSVVNRFAKGVGSLKLQAMREVLFQRDLQRVETGIAHGVLRIDAGEDGNEVRGATRPARRANRLAKGRRVGACSRE